MSRIPLSLLLVALLLVPSAPALGWERGEVTIVESGGLSPETLAALEEIVSRLGVRSGVVHVGTLRMLSVRRGEEPVQLAPPGFGYPMAAAALDPAVMRPLVGERIGDVLESGRVVMSEISAGLRGARVGDAVTLEGWNGQVEEVILGAVVPDEAMGWNELLLGPRAAGALAFHRPARMELWGEVQPSLAALLLRYRLPPGPVRIRVGSPDRPTPDATLPLAIVKQRFGEFAFRPLGRGDAIEVEDGWVRDHIVSVELPRLGAFRCHRLVVPYVRAALEEAERLGLGAAIDREDFQRAGGCFNPRLMRGGDKGSALSRHAWGIAVDLNPSTNPYGGPVRIDRRLADLLRQWGFAWGGGWGRPDGMHFEWARLPEAGLARCSSHLLAPLDELEGAWEVYARRDRCALS